MVVLLLLLTTDFKVMYMCYVLQKIKIFKSISAAWWPLVIAEKQANVKLLCCEVTVSKSNRRVVKRRAWHTFNWVAISIVNVIHSSRNVSQPKTFILYTTNLSWGRLCDTFLLVQTLMQDFCTLLMPIS